MIEKIGDRGVTFDDVLLEPQWSDIVPSQVDVKTRLTSSIQLNIPLLSAPMDTVTESRMAIALAQEGGLGIIHKNLSIELQADEVRQSEAVSQRHHPHSGDTPPRCHSPPGSRANGEVQSLGNPHYRGERQALRHPHAT